MYQNKLAVAIKHNGKILRENKDIVKLPFGSEFSVLVKNLNSRRVKFTLHIDGSDVLDGSEIIVDANSAVELKRFIRNGNMNEGNAFKFIERTQQIEDGPRGIKVEDGIVRVEFWFEQEAPDVKTVIHKHYDEWYYGYPYRRHYWGNPYEITYSARLNSASLADVPLKGTAVRGMSVGSNSAASLTSGSNSAFTADADAATFATNSVTSTSSDVTKALNDAGITVPGSKVEQKFHTVYGFNSETKSSVIVLRLVGVTADDVRIEKAVTVKAKQKCTTCGKVNKATSKFCSGCGTALDLL